MNQIPITQAGAERLRDELKELKSVKRPAVIEANGEAPRETLIRRLSLDLTGLPPTPQEVQHFVSDPSPEAYERLVDRLLASPRYGERMALVWAAEGMMLRLRASRIRSRAPGNSGASERIRAGKISCSSRSSRGSGCRTN